MGRLFKQAPICRNLLRHCDPAAAVFKSRIGCRLSEDHFAFMSERFIFGMHWKYDGKMYYDEVPAGSKDEAIAYFVECQRGDVVLVRVDLVGPNDRRVPGDGVAPSLPFGPSSERSRLDTGADA